MVRLNAHPATPCNAGLHHGLPSGRARPCTRAARDRTRRRGRAPCNHARIARRHSDKPSVGVDGVRGDAAAYL